jgi:hypothetical protein
MRPTVERGKARHCLRLAAFAGIVTPRAAPPSRAEGGRGKGFPDITSSAPPRRLTSATVPARVYPSLCSVRRAGRDISCGGRRILSDDLLHSIQ